MLYCENSARSSAQAAPETPTSGSGGGKFPALYLQLPRGKVPVRDRKEPAQSPSSDIVFRTTPVSVRYSLHFIDI